MPPQVLPGFSLDVDVEQDHSERGRWTRFAWEPPIPPDQFMIRFLNVLLYVFHIIRSNHFHAFLFGRRHRRRRYYINPNSTRGRRYRRISRAKADMSRSLRSFWAQVQAVPSSPAAKRKALRATDRPIPARASLQAAAPTARLPLVSPPVLSTPLEVEGLAAASPSLSLVCQVVATVSPCPLHHSTTPLWMPDAAVTGSLCADKTWLSVPPQTVAVTELCQSGRVVTAGGWKCAVQPGVDGLWIVGRGTNIHSRPGYIKVNRPPFDPRGSMHVCKGNTQPSPRSQRAR